MWHTHKHTRQIKPLSKWQKKKMSPLKWAYLTRMCAMRELWLPSSRAGPQITPFYPMSFLCNTEELPYGLYISLCQLTYGKNWFHYTSFCLKLQNLWMTLSENLLYNYFSLKNTRMNTSNCLVLGEDKCLIPFVSSYYSW